jgi:hypothetical protein
MGQPLNDRPMITGEFQLLRHPQPEIADRGTVRLGDACITAEFPPIPR